MRERVSPTLSLCVCVCVWTKPINAAPGNSEGSRKDAEEFVLPPSSLGFQLLGGLSIQVSLSRGIASNERLKIIEKVKIFPSYCTNRIEEIKKKKKIINQIMKIF